MTSVAGELAAEEEERRLGADQRDRADQAVDEPEAGARQQVVGQGVAGEALDQAERRAAPTPISQFSSRGLRKAPVKNTRSMCTIIAATNSIAAQWWIWRISRPPRTSKLMFSVDA